MNNINTLTNLTISSSVDVSVNADFSGIENLTNMEILTLYYNSPNIYIDFLKMPNLRTLIFGNSPYTVVIDFDSKMYERLIQKGCDINFKNEADLFKFVAANKQLDEIVSSFKLRENASDVEKFDAMLCWILENFRYSPEIVELGNEISKYEEAVKENSEYKKNLDEAKLKYGQLVAKFYEEGLLTAFFEENGAPNFDSICGNYAAFFEALAHRVDFNSNYVVSENHAYNLVIIDEEYYYVDATWLDPIMTTNVYYDEKNEEVIRAGNGKDLEWYLCNPEDVLTYDDSGSHIAQNIPSDFDFNNVKTNTEEEKAFDITGKLVEIVVNNKIYIIPATIFIAILITFGLARKAKKAKKNRNPAYTFDEWGNLVPYADNHPTNGRHR